MAQYELVRESPNLCRNNQMRDVFFDEIETEAPVSWVRQFLKGTPELTVDRRPDGAVTVFAVIDGMTQKFLFTPIDRSPGAGSPVWALFFSEKRQN